MTEVAMQQEVLKDLLKRIRRIEGQARGVQSMLESGADCEQVLMQLAAMKSALNRVSLKLLGCHMGQQMAAEIRDGGTGIAALEEAMEAFLHL